MLDDKLVGITFVIRVWEEQARLDGDELASIRVGIVDGIFVHGGVKQIDRIDHIDVFLEVL